MQDPAEKFIQAALAAAPGNNEVRQHLAAELTAFATSASEESLNESTTRLQAGRLPRSTRRLWSAIATATVLITVLCMAINAHSFIIYRQSLFQIIGRWGSKLTMPDRSVIPGVDSPTSHQRLLLLGAPGRTELPDQFQSLAESQPGNPVYYAIYIRQLCSREGKLPADFVERVQQTDPGNGILFLTAMQTASKAVHADKHGIYQIVDEAGFDEGMRYFHLAAAAPMLRDRIEDATGERIAALPPARDFLAMETRMGFLLSQDGVYSSIPLALPQLLCAAAERSATDDDDESFRRLSAEWKAVSEKLLSTEPVSLMDLLLKRAALMAVSKSFATTATHFGLKEDAAYYGRVLAGLARLKQEIADSHHQAEAGFSYARDTSLLSMANGTLVPQVPAADFEPGRLTFHACLLRITTFIASLLFLFICGGTAAYRFRGSGLSRSLAHLSRQMLWRKILPVAVTAALLPLVIFQLHLWSPWGASQWNSFWGGMILANLQALAALFLALLLPLCIVRRLLSSSDLPHLAGTPGRISQGFGWAAVCCCGAAWVVTGIIPQFSGFEALFTHDFSLLAGVGKPEITDSCGDALWVACGLLGLAALYLATLGIRALVSSRTRLPLRLTEAKLLLTPYLAVLLLLGLLQPLLHEAESNWATHDPISGIDPAHPAVSRGEYLTLMPTYLRMRDLLREAGKSSP